MPQILYGAGDKHVEPYDRGPSPSCFSAETGDRTIYGRQSVIMKEMAKHVPDVGAYSPVTILVDERLHGVI